MKKLLLLFLPLVAIIAGCEKENEKSKDQEGLLTYGKLIKSATVSIMGEDYLEYNFRYDTNDRLINMDIQVNDSYHDELICMNCSYEYTESKVSVNVTGDDAYFIIFESLLFEPVNEDRSAGIPGEDPAALVVAVGVVRQAHCAGELPDDGGEGGRDSVLGDDVEIVEGDEKFVELGLLAGPFER